MFFRHALGRAPGPDDQKDFVAMIRAVESDGYSANRLIHRFVDTDTFGSP
jgi:hypothetical protein